MSALLAIENLQVQREEQLVLDVARLEVQERGVLAVIGPNGAGKSTLLLAISRLLKPSAGEILFRGEPVWQQDTLEYRRRIGLVLQEPLLLDGTVFDNVAAGLRFRKLPRDQVHKRVETWLERLGISHLRNRRAQRLSGGESQRVSLARAFALAPELLLLDEPFSALDAPTRQRLLEDFQALLAETRITTIFITHDLDEALYLGEQVAVLLNGRLHQVGPPDQVFAAPADEDVAAFVGVETVIPGRVIQSGDGQVIVEAGGFSLQAIGEIGVGRSVLFCLRPEDVTLWEPNGPQHSSARNQLHGRIQRLVPQGPLTRVVLDCGFPLVALITHSSAQEMKLAEGVNVTAAFKASAVHLIPR